MNAKEARGLANSTLSASVSTELSEYYSDIREAAKKGSCYISIFSIPSIGARRVLESDGYEIKYMSDEGQGRSWYQIKW